MNKERDDEREARRVVERTLGVELEHADKRGGVDYRSLDGRHAVEVTRVTDGRRRAGRKALDKSREEGVADGELGTCWVVLVPDTQHGLRTFLQDVQPAVVKLEKAGESLFERQRAAIHVIKDGPLSPIYRPLLDAGIERASAVPNHSRRRHAHRIISALGSGGRSGGSNEALALLCNALSSRKDNAKKLGASGSERRHLFVWLDDDTRFDIARPLSHGTPSQHEGFGMPSRPPKLDPAITDLWVVHQRSGMGWIWGNEAWQEVRDL